MDVKEKLDLIKYRKMILKNKDMIYLEKKKTIKNNSYSDIHIFHKTKLKEFNKTQEKLDSEKEKLMEENTKFLNSYNSIRKIFPKKIEESFKDLLIEYKEKGYKKPNFSLKRNLFRPNPLLMENNKLLGYYIEKRKKQKVPKYIYKNFIEKKEDKHLSFLKKEEKLVNEEFYKYKKIKEEEKILGIEHNKKKKCIIKNFSGKNMIQIIKDSTYNILTEEENEKIKKYNKTIEKIIPVIKIKHKSLKENKLYNFTKITKSNFLINNKSYKSFNFDENSFSNLNSVRTEENSLSLVKNEKKINNKQIRFIDFKNNKIQNLKKKTILNKIDMTIQNLIKENEHDKFLDNLQSINLNQLKRKDLEFIAKTYCHKFLKYTDIAIEDLLKPRVSDNDLIILIKQFINRVNHSVETNNQNIFIDKSLKEKYHKMNHESKNLRKKFIEYISNKTLN